MITRLRARSGLYLSALLLLAGVSLTARATQPVTRSEMESFVYVTLAVGAGALIGAVWTLLSYHLGRLERMFETGVSRLEASQARSHELLRTHNEDAHAHTAASEHNHGPMQEQLDRLETQVGTILRDCEALTCGKRDPAASSSRRRASDPEGEDHAEERGAR